MAARLRVTSIGMPAQNAATILKTVVLNPHATSFTHGATCSDWVAPFPHSQHSPPPALKLFHTPLPPPPLSFPTLRAREGAITITIEQKKNFIE